LDLGPFKTVAQNRSLIFALQHFQARESPKNDEKIIENGLMDFVDRP
jgi:hypothetical protein